MSVYIYSFIEGETKWSSDEPTDIDCDAVAEGQLEVLRVQVVDNGPPELEVHSLDSDGEWEPATEAELSMTHGQEWHE